MPNETDRFNWPVPAWNADWQKWQDTFQDLIRNVDSTVFATMSNMTLVMKDLPNVEVKEMPPASGDWFLEMVGPAVFISRTHLTEITLPAETVTLVAGSILALTFTPGAVGPQAIEWEVYSQGVDIAPEVVPVGYVDQLYNIIWFNGAELAAGGGAQGLFEFPTSALSAGDKVRVSAADALANYLDSKVVAGTNVVMTILNPGANEQLQVNVPVASVPTWYGDVHVDIVYGDDIGGTGQVGNPYQTLARAAAVELASVPIDQATYEESRTFILATGVYDHTGVPGGAIQMPYRSVVKIIGSQVSIIGDILWYQDPNLMFTSTIAQFYIGSPDTPTIEFTGDVIVKNSVPTAGLTMPDKEMGLEQVIFKGNIENQKSTRIVVGEGTGDLRINARNCLFNYGGPTGHIFGENEGAVGDTNAVVIVGWNTYFRSNFYGNIRFENVENSWIAGIIDYAIGPLGAFLHGAIEGVSGKSFINTVFAGGGYAFGNAVGATDVWFDANSWASIVSAGPPTFTNNDYVLIDEAQGVAVDASGFSGPWLSATDTDVQTALETLDSGIGWTYPPDAVIIVQHGATFAANGVLLLAAYVAAKALTPSGQALSATNRALLIVPPGEYDLVATTLVVDSAYVDIQGFGVARTKSDGVTILESPDTRIYNGALGGIVIQQTVDGARVNALAVKQTQGGTIYELPATCVLSSYIDIHLEYSGALPVAMVQALATDTIAGYFEHCYTTADALIGDCAVFDGKAVNCSGGDRSFAGLNAATHTMVSGVCIDCIGGDYSFGSNSGAGNAIVSGTFIDCVGGTNSFCNNAGTGAATMTGTCTRCEAGDYSFGYIAALAAADVLHNGIFTDCVGGDYSFGSNGGAANITLFGTLIDCVGGNHSFGNNHGTGNATLSGICTRCTGGAFTFGYAAAGNALCSGELTDCINGKVASSFGSSGTVGTGKFSGTATRCIAGNKSFGCSRNSDGECSGDLIDCVFNDYCAGSNYLTGQGSFTGTAVGCTGRDYCYGFSHVGADGLFNGTVKDCRGRNYCFGAVDAGGGGTGGKVTATAVLTQCNAGISSFGGSDVVASSIDAFLGTATLCSSSGNSFGNNNIFNGVMRACTTTGDVCGGIQAVGTDNDDAVIDNCQCSGLVNWILLDGAQVLKSRFNMVTALRPVFCADNTGAYKPKLDYSVLICEATTAESIESVTPLTNKDIIMSHCEMNVDIGVDITNLVPAGGNVASVNVAR